MSFALEVECTHIKPLHSSCTYRQYLPKLLNSNIAITITCRSSKRQYAMWMQFPVSQHVILWCASFFVIRSLNVTMCWRVRWSNPGVGEIFGTRPARPLEPPILQYNGLCVIPEGYIGRILTLTTHPHLGPNLKKAYALRLFSLWTFVACSR
jgi:hypothetical protein